MIKEKEEDELIIPLLCYFIIARKRHVECYSLVVKELTGR